MITIQIITEIFAEIFCPTLCSSRSGESLDSWIEKWLTCMFYIVHCIDNKAFRILTSFLAQM